MIKEPARSRNITTDAPPARTPDPLAEEVARIRHDLGKYVAFELRWLPPDADAESLRAALRADVAATRRDGALVETAPGLWERLRPSLAALGDDPDVAAVDAAVAILRDLIPDLETAGPERLASGAAAAFAVAEALKRLDRRVRGAPDRA
jgi:hypothetical protein